MINTLWNWRIGGFNPSTFAIIGGAAAIFFGKGLLRKLGWGLLIYGMLGWALQPASESSNQELAQQTPTTEAPTLGRMTE